MALNGTMVKIETVTVGSGGTTSIDLQNIPQTYTDLVIYASLRQSGVVSNTAALLFNNSSANFTYRRLRGDGSAAVSDTIGSALTTYSGQTASTFSNNYIYIPNYTSSNNKSFSIDAVNENNATSSEQWLIAGLWSQTAAISRITINPVSTYTFDQHSTVTLYGVVPTTSQIKAIGGTITEDNSYVYHTFTSSGTFTPKSNVAISCTVVGGGGGGGAGGTGGLSGRGGGGGGSGGSVTSNQSVTANTVYTVTVGARGAGSTSPGTGCDGNGTNGTAGGSSSITGNSFTTVSAGGGGGGQGGNGTAVAIGGSAGTPNGNTGSNGGYSVAGTCTSTTPQAGGNGGDSPYSGTGGIGGSGGCSVAGTAGSGYGAGGGGGQGGKCCGGGIGSGCNAGNGGNGSDGVVIIYYAKS